MVPQYILLYTRTLCIQKSRFCSYLKIVAVKFKSKMLFFIDDGECSGGVGVGEWKKGEAGKREGDGGVGKRKKEGKKKCV